MPLPFYYISRKKGGLQGLTSIEFGPGACEHHFKGHYSGEEVNADGYTIYCNTYTPTKRVYTLKVKQ